MHQNITSQLCNNNKQVTEESKRRNWKEQHRNQSNHATVLAFPAQTFGMYPLIRIALIVLSSSLSSAIALILIYNVIKGVHVWGSRLFWNDPLLHKAKMHFLEHKKMIREQIEKTKRGGYLRRRQEACAIIITQISVENCSKYLAQQHIIIKKRVRKERQRVISLYHADFLHTRSA